MNAWIHNITPGSSIVRYHTFSTPVSPSYTKLSLSSIDCNIDEKDILQTLPRWTPEWEVMLMI